MIQTQQELERLKTLQESYDDLSGGMSVLADKIDNIKLPEIDTTELAKQGENQEATNSAIYGTLNEIKGDVIDIVKLQLEEVDNLLDI